MKDTDNRKVKGSRSEWQLVGASVAGLGHRDTNGNIIIPCQDAHNYTIINPWCIAIVADGAGSYENSQIGASYCVEKLPILLRKKIQTGILFDEKKYINEDGWRAIVIEILIKIKKGLMNLALKKKIDYKTLGCTVNFLVFNSEILFSGHIGDGRAALRIENGKWKPIITPFKGETVGETVFITSDYCWENPDECIETTIHRTTKDNEIDAVVLLSDGMEDYTFRCYVKDEESDEEFYYDPNEPFAPFLNGNLEILKKKIQYDGLSETNLFWKRYLQYGPKIKEEFDDKTLLMIFKIKPEDES